MVIDRSWRKTILAILLVFNFIMNFYHSLVGLYYRSKLADVASQ